MMSVSTIILEYVCPGIGVVICQFMFSAPLQDVRKAWKVGRLGSLNPTPWAFMLGNCFGWMMYAIWTQRNFFIFWANAPGFLLAVYFNLTAVQLTSVEHYSRHMKTNFIQEYGKQRVVQQEGEEERITLQDDETGRIEAQAQAQADNEQNVRASAWATEQVVDKSCQASVMPVKIDEMQNDEEQQQQRLQHNHEVDSSSKAETIWTGTTQGIPPKPQRHEALVLGMVMVWAATLCFLGFAQTLNTNTQQMIIGTLVNFNLVFFYGAPLSTIYTVLCTRNSASIHIRTMITNTLNGTFWFIYGLAILDAFVYVPNGLGTLLGLIQIVLVFIFPRVSVEEKEKERIDETLPVNKDRKDAVPEQDPYNIETSNVATHQKEQQE